ncbi:ribosomal protein S18 acetylase RimI-like enzyme [Weissella uvarum]|uniref:GNAT family N-acetyltransferase n=1 Tax=Weissella uvarum TaxID=1479233 RepID=UPI0019610563|nr:GNAT family N-acetyltransferase [Weissella uvarum]MBM7616937.1 ribosomal protein S18 acetylase RimI-like enzyme [Weissella uvarum]MCM0594614.1 GNAT family N-acetyltransferase [Weissella uvarum]
MTEYAKAKLVPVTQQDVVALQTISAQTFKETFLPFNDTEDVEQYVQRAYALDQLRDELRDENSQWFFLMVAGEPVAYLKVNVGDAQTEERGDDSLEVQRIYVLAGAQRHGYGKLLMEEALKLAQAAHKSKVWLGVWEQNTKAIAFYQQFGFEPVDDHVFMMGKKPQRDLILEKRL